MQRWSKWARHREEQSNWARGGTGGDSIAVGGFGGGAAVEENRYVCWESDVKGSLDASNEVSEQSTKSSMLFERYQQASLHATYVRLRDLTSWLSFHLDPRGASDGLGKGLHFVVSVQRSLVPPLHQSSQTLAACKTWLLHLVVASPALLPHSHLYASRSLAAKAQGRILAATTAARVVVIASKTARASSTHSAQQEALQIRLEASSCLFSSIADAFVLR